MDPQHSSISASSLSRSFLDKCSFGSATDSSGGAATYSYAQFRGTPNEDRFSVSKEWEFGGHIWQLSAVFDGHGGPTTAEYLSQTFPEHIRTSMEKTFAMIGPTYPGTPSQPRAQLHLLSPPPLPPSSSLPSFPSPPPSSSSPSSTKVILTDSPASISLRTSPGDITPSTRSNENKSEDVFTEHAISNFLKQQVRVFDDELGNAVKAVCPNPVQIQNDKKAKEALYSANREVIARARCGSTMAAILVDKGNTKGRMRMWVCCVGDSSVVLSTKQPGSGNRKRKSLLVNKHHTGQTPMEYHRVSLEHPSSERENIWLDGDERIFGTLGMTRAFGDYMYKFPRPFTSALFSQVPSTAAKSVESVLKYNRTPPYVIADPFVTFMDLEAVKKSAKSEGGGGGNDTEADEDLAVIIYSDGLEALAYRLAMAIRNKRGSGSDSSDSSVSSISRSPSPRQTQSQTLPYSLLSPVDVIGAHVGQPRTKSGAEFARSNGFPESKSNEAFDLMYSLLVKSISGKLKTHLGIGRQDDIVRTDPFALEEMYIDDVTVIVFRPFGTSCPGR